MIRYLFALILTCLVEFSVVYLVLKRDPLKLLFYSTIVNAFTLPIATNLYLHTRGSFVAIEIGVFLVESLLLMWLLEIRYRTSVQISFFANLVTSTISLLFFI